MKFIFGMDEGFEMPVGVAIRSLDRFLNQDDQIVVLHLGLEERSLAQLRSCAQRSAFTDVDCRDLMHPSWKTRSTHISEATFLRLLAPEVLPDDSRCVYLDGDLVVRHDPKPFHDLELLGKSSAAVRSRTIPFIGSQNGITQWRQLGIRSSAPYFNAGVLLLDLDQWRAREVTERANKFLALYGGATSLADQDALNVALVDDWIELDRTWNYVTYVANYFMQLPDAEPEDPSIVHFAGLPKPWSTGEQPIFSEDWHELLRGSPWEGFQPPPPPADTTPWARRRIRRVLQKAKDLVRSV